MIETTDGLTLPAMSAMDPSLKLAELPSVVDDEMVMGVSPRFIRKRERVRLVPDMSRAKITKMRVMKLKSYFFLGFSFLIVFTGSLEVFEVICFSSSSMIMGILLLIH